LPTLVRAFDALAVSRPDLCLVIAGPPGWGLSDFEQSVASARHRDRVIRTGWVDATVRADLLAGAAVLALPSIYEGFGYAAVEAMAAGTPVVSSSAGALGEVVGGAGVIVAPGDYAALGAALEAVIEDSGFADRLRASGRERAGRFDWASCGEGLVELYRDAAAAQT